MCLARLLDEKRTPDQHLQTVLQLQVIHRLLTGFAVAQQDEVAYAKAVEERRRELEDQRALDFEKHSQERMRRAARPVG